MNTLKNKLKSKFVLVSLLSALILILTELKLIDLEQSKTIKVIFEAILGSLILLGVLNNPDQEKF